MGATNDKTAAGRAEQAFDFRDAPKPVFRVYLPMAAAVIVAVSSFATLTAYDKPLDRQALTPSVMDFIEINAEAPMAPPAPQPPKAHAMLLRYDVMASAADVSPWRIESQGQAAFRTVKQNAHPALL
jgi:hypothetical protein